MSSFQLLVVKMGAYFQDFHMGDFYCNRPYVKIEEKCRWGNEYLMIPNHLKREQMNGNHYLVNFNHDKKDIQYVRFQKYIPRDELKNEEVYDLICFDHFGTKINKKFSIFPAHEDSRSCIFSSAYCEVEPNYYNSQTLFILEHDDVVAINNMMFKYNAQKKKLFLNKNEEYDPNDLIIYSRVPEQTRV